MCVCVCVKCRKVYLDENGFSGPSSNLNKRVYVLVRAHALAKRILPFLPSSRR